MEMKLCVVGIGGAGGNVTREFIGNVDLDFNLISSITKAEYISPGMMKGIWLDADKNDARNLQHFFGDINDGAYPAFFIPHDAIEDASDIHIFVKEKYGYDVKKQGFVRDAQYIKAIFEIFDSDCEIQELAAREFDLLDSRDRNGNSEEMEKIGLKEDPNNGNGNGNGNGVGNSNCNSFKKQAPNPIFDCAWNAIKPYTTLGGGDCDGILFIVSFGGGTGTGFINPIISHIRNEGNADYPVFVLGILTEFGDFTDRAQFSEEGRRNLAAISALYDLLTESNGANGVILVDNQILVDKFGKDYAAMNKFIYQMMMPMVLGRDYPGETPPSQAVAHNFTKGLSRPPLFVPLFSTTSRCKNPEEGLVRRALATGRLFGCTPEKADIAVVFCRGFVDSEKIRKALSKQTGISDGKIWVLRKMGDKGDEILIMLRNPYGDDPRAYTREGTLENRFCRVISMALQYMNQNAEDLLCEGKESRKRSKDGSVESIKLTEKAKQALEKFFFGEQGFIRDNFGKEAGFAYELREARRRLRDGEKPFFIYPMRIYPKGDRTLENSGKNYCQDGDEISRIVDKRIKEILAEQGLLNVGFQKS
jgi:hypothetical protein